MSLGFCNFYQCEQMHMQDWLHNFQGSVQMWGPSFKRQGKVPEGKSDLGRLVETERPLGPEVA